MEGYVPPMEIAYAGSANFGFWYRLFKGSLDLEGFFGPFLRKALDMGITTIETVQTALREVEEWHNSPYAFQMSGMVLVAGKVE